MSDRPSLVSNLFYSALSWLSTIGLLVVQILAARILGTETYGRFAFCYALVALFEVVTDFGMREYLVREIARARERTAAFLGESLALKSLLSVLTIALLLLVSRLLRLPRETQIVIAILAVAMIAKSYKLVLRSALIAHERFRREAFIATADRLLVVVACSLSLFLDGRLIPFVIVFAASGVVNLAVTAAAVGDLRRAEWPRKRAQIVRLLRASLPFGLTAAAFLAYFRFDSVMLAIMRGDAEVGWYNAAYRLAEGLIVIPTLIQYAIFPRLSTLSRESIVDLGRRTLKFVSAISCFVAAAGIIVAQPVVDLLYGAAYGPTVAALQLLLLGLPFMFTWSVLIVVLNATDRPSVPFYGVVAGSLLNIGLNLALIPSLGHLGACLATVAAEVCLSVFLIVALRRGGLRLDLVGSFARPLLALVLAVPAMIWLEPINFMAAAFVGGALYVASLWFAGFLDETDRAVVRRLATKLTR